MVVNDIFLFIEKLRAFLWGPVTIFLILGVGIYITIATGFFQLFNIKDIFKNTIGDLKKSDGGKGGISPFQAVSTALAGSLGTGNIFGVATALVAGGPGAIFWMWVSAFFGMMLKYSEVLLCVKYRVLKSDGLYSGGPMYVMEKGLKSKLMGKIFALFCVFASFGIGSTVQTNSAAIALNKGFGIPKYITAVVLSVIFFVVIIGGIKRLGAIASKVVPFMSLTYIIIALIVIFKNIEAIPNSFRLILDGAFSFRSGVSGAMGYCVNAAMQYGIARSVFVSEAGLGSSPIAHAASSSTSNVKQAQWGIFEVFFSTIVMCTMTALVIISTGALNICENKEQLTLFSFSKEIGDFSNIIIAVCTVLFGFTTTMSWCYYAEQSIEYGFGKKFITFYRIIYILSIGVGGICAIEFVWQLSDIFNALMAFPNLIAIVLLSPEIFKITKKHKEKIKQEKMLKKLEKNS